VKYIKLFEDKNIDKRKEVGIAIYKISFLTNELSWRYSDFEDNNIDLNDYLWHLPFTMRSLDEVDLIKIAIHFYPDLTKKEVSFKIEEPYLSKFEKIKDNTSNDKYGMYIELKFILESILKALKDLSRLEIEIEGLNKELYYLNDDRDTIQMKLFSDLVKNTDKFIQTVLSSLRNDMFERETIELLKKINR
jgi:hypothetical protein